MANSHEHSNAAQQEPVTWGVDWGRAGDIPCVSIIKRMPGGGIEVVAVEYAPYSYTSPPAQRKPLQIGDESAAFKEWFDAWWVGDGDICKSVTNEVEQTRSYKSQYTLAFGAWVAAKYAANNIKEQP